MIWLYWLCFLCCTTIRHYKFVLIIPLMTEIEKYYNYVSLWIYLTLKIVCCSGRRRTSWLLIKIIKMWVQKGITWILYSFKITLLNHMLTMILHIYEKHTCLLCYYTDNFERRMTLSVLMCKYLKIFYTFSESLIFKILSAPHSQCVLQLPQMCKRDLNFFIYRIKHFEVYNFWLYNQFNELWHYILFLYKLYKFYCAPWPRFWRITFKIILKNKGPYLIFFIWFEKFLLNGVFKTK